MDERREVVLFVGSFLWLCSSLLKANIQAGRGEKVLRTENGIGGSRMVTKGMERKRPLP